MSCRTAKTATTETDSTVATQNDVVENKTLDVQHNQSTTQQQDLQENETLEETITETTWSKPDSTGNQYPISTKTTERRRTKDKNQETITNQEGQTGVQATAQTVDKTVSDSTMNVRTSTTKKSSPSGLIWLGVGVALTIIVIIFFKFVWKRIKL